MRLGNRIESSDGRSIAAYRFGNPSEIREGQLGGRTAFLRRFKRALYDQRKVNIHIVGTPGGKAPIPRMHALKECA